MIQRGLLATVALVLLGCSVAVADELADIEKKLQESFAKVKSYTAKTKSMMDLTYGPNHTEKSEDKGTYEWIRRDGRVQFRFEFVSDRVATEDGKQTKSKTKTLGVCDGEHMYMLSEDAGKKTVIKSKAMDPSDYETKTLLAQLRESHTIKVLPEEKVDGADCFVLELKQKPEEGTPPGGRSLMYFRKDLGMSVKGVAYDADGKIIHSNVSTDIKLNPDISADRFEFKVPPDAEFIDATKFEQSPEGEQPPPEEEPEQPKQEEKQEKEKKDKKPRLPKLPKLP